MAEQNLPALPDMEIDSRGAMVPKKFADLWWMAKLFAKEGLCPKQYVNKPESIIVAWQMGVDLGMNRMAALQSIAVINGMPAVYGDAQLAIALESEKIDDVIEYYEGDQYLKDGKENDNFTAVCEVKLKNGRVVKETFSVRDAKTAKLWMKKGHNGGDTPWVGYWKRMLKMRARSFALRDAVPSALKGIKQIEEIEHEPTIVQERKTFDVKAPEPIKVAAASIETVQDAEIVDQPAQEPAEPAAPAEEPAKQEAPAEEPAELSDDEKSFSRKPVEILRETCDITFEQVKEFLIENAKANECDLDTVIDDINKDLRPYYIACMNFFNKEIPPDALEEPEVKLINFYPDPVPGAPVKPRKPVEEMDEEEHDLDDARIISAFLAFNKEQAKKHLDNDRAVPRLKAMLPQNKRVMYNRWVELDLGPCPFYQEEQPQLPIKDIKPTDGKGPLPLVPADYPQSPDRKYSFALSNARKRFPDEAEIAREELKYGRLVMSEEGAKIWYEKIVEVLNRPQKSNRKSKR